MLAILRQGSQPLWKSEKNFENEFPFFQSGKTREFDRDPEGKGGKVFARLAYVCLIFFVLCSMNGTHLSRR